MQHKQQQLLDLQRELTLAQQEVSTARSKTISHVSVERQQEEHAAASAAASASEGHRLGLDSILQRLSSWHSDVLAEVYRNGHLAAMFAPQTQQQHQQQLLTSPPLVTDVSIAIK